MEFRTLKYFLTVAREENITRAAALLHLTQPTLSRQLMQLEEELGVKLFRRSQHHIVLTEAGMLLRRRAQEILELVDRPMIAGQITAAICRRDQLLTKKPQRALRFERNVRFFLEYLVDQGELELVCQRGAAFYRRPQRD